MANRFERYRSLSPVFLSSGILVSIKGSRASVCRRPASHQPKASTLVNLASPFQASLSSIVGLQIPLSHGALPDLGNLNRRSDHRWWKGRPVSITACPETRCSLP